MTKNVKCANVLLHKFFLRDLTFSHVFWTPCRSNYNGSIHRKADDVHSIRALLGEEGKHIKVISKIENKEGIDNVDEIIQARFLQEMKYKN